MEEFFVHLHFFTLTASMILTIQWPKLKKSYQFFWFCFIFVQWYFSARWVFYIHEIDALDFNAADSIGSVLSTWSLALPILYILSSQTHFNRKKLLESLGVSFIFSIIILLLQYSLAKGCHYCIYSPENENRLTVLYVQLVLSITGFFALSILSHRSKYWKSHNIEDYSPIILLLALGLFYLMDVLTIISRINLLYNNVQWDWARKVEPILNTLLGMGLLYTSYIQRMGSRLTLIRPKNKLVYSVNIDTLRPTWKELIRECEGQEHAPLVKRIDSIEDLTPTDKLYWYADQFELSAKELSEKFHVSIRTVETNRYRLKKKLNSLSLDNLFFQKN